MASIILNDDIVLSESQIRRLPVFASMIQDLNTQEPINVLVSDDKSASDISRYASCKDNMDYVLPADADVARHTLDWCGVDVSDLRTPRELRAELHDKTVQLEQQKTALTDVAYLDYVEFVCPTRVSIFVSKQFDFTKFANCNHVNVKNMEDLVASWQTEQAPAALTETFWNMKMRKDTSMVAMQHFTHFGTVSDELYKVISVIRNMHGCQKVVKL